jgi:hypothetical protein
VLVAVRDRHPQALAPDAALGSYEQQLDLPPSHTIDSGPSTFRAQPMRAFARRFGLRFDVGVPHDPFIREKFTREQTAARKLATEYFRRYPKDRYRTEVESWRNLQSANIEFTMKRLRDPIEAAHSARIAAGCVRTIPIDHGKARMPAPAGVPACHARGVTYLIRTERRGCRTASGRILTRRGGVINGGWSRKFEDGCRS